MDDDQPSTNHVSPAELSAGHDTLQSAADHVISTPRENRRRKETTLTGVQLIEERERQRKTVEMLDALSAMWPGEGREGQWCLDEQRLYAQGPETTMQRIPAITEDVIIKQHLVALFFRHRYSIFPIIPKRKLYDHIERRDTLCTPLLLYAMYAHASHFSDDHVNNADIYFERAISILDDYMEEPQLSTVAALCLLSLYESPRCEMSRGNLNNQSRSRLYASMACRMCLDLGLHKRYLITDKTSNSDLEVRKRILWSCYCLDKMQNICVGRPWSILSKDIDLDMPLLQPGDDVEEHEVLEYFVTFIKLLQICERTIQTDAICSARSVIRSYDQEQMAYSMDSELLLWLRSLPARLQWTPFPTHPNAVLTQPPPSAMVAHMHLFYNLIELGVLRPYSASSGKTIHQRCSTVATNLTQLTYALAEQPNFILSFSYVADATMAALRVHLLNCSDRNLSFARHSRFMFQRSLRSLKVLYQCRSISHIEQSIQSIGSIIQAADEEATNRAVGYSISKADRVPGALPNGHGPNGAVATNTPNSIVKSSAASGDEQQHQQQVGNFMNEHFTPTVGIDGWRAPPPPPQQQQQQQRQSYPLSLLSVEDAWPPKSPDSNLESLLYKNRLLFPDQPESIFVDERGKQMMAAKSSNLFTDSTATKFNDTQIATLMAQMSNKNSNAPNNDQQNNASWSALGTEATAAEDGSTLLYSLWSQHQQQQQQQQAQQQSQQRQVSDPEQTGQRNQDSRQQSQQASPQQQQPQQQVASSQSFPYQPSYMNIGLGVYASAHQHHTDVIRQHFPDVESRTNPSVRPVILTHHGHVIVASSNGNDMSHSQA